MATLDENFNYKIIIRFEHRDNFNDVVFIRRNCAELIELLEILAKDYPRTPPRWTKSPNQKDCRIEIYIDYYTLLLCACHNVHELQNIITGGEQHITDLFLSSLSSSTGISTKEQ